MSGALFACLFLLGIAQSQQQDCTNKHTLCSQWASSGDCDRDANFMNAYCPKSCLTACGAPPRGNNQGPTIILPNPQVAAAEAAASGDVPLANGAPVAGIQCTDLHEACDIWANVYMECPKYPTFMNRVCTKSCNPACKVTEPPAPEPETPAPTAAPTQAPTEAPESALWPDDKEPLTNPRPNAVAANGAGQPVNIGTAPQQYVQIWMVPAGSGVEASYSGPQEEVPPEGEPEPEVEPEPETEPESEEDSSEEEEEPATPEVTNEVMGPVMERGPDGQVIIRYEKLFRFQGPAWPAQGGAVQGPGSVAPAPVKAPPPAATAAPPQPKPTSRVQPSKPKPRGGHGGAGGPQRPEVVAAPSRPNNGPPKANQIQCVDRHPQCSVWRSGNLCSVPAMWWTCAGSCHPLCQSAASANPQLFPAYTNPGELNPAPAQSVSVPRNGRITLLINGRRRRI